MTVIRNNTLNINLLQYVKFFLFIDTSILALICFPQLYPRRNVYCSLLYWFLLQVFRYFVMISKNQNIFNKTEKVPQIFLMQNSFIDFFIILYRKNSIKHANKVRQTMNNK